MGERAVARKSVKIQGFDYSERFQEFEGLIREQAFIAYTKIRQVAMIDLDDLVNDGHLYMLQVSSKYDWGKGVKFSTFMTTALQRFYINSVSYHYRGCRKGNMNAADVDTYIPNVHKDYDMICSIDTPDELDEETKYKGTVESYLPYIEERDREVYLMLAGGRMRGEIMETLGLKPWSYSFARKRIQESIREVMRVQQEF